MRTAGWLLMVLWALGSFGCARGDWISETLTLVNVSGTWDGTVGGVGGIQRMISIQLVLRQSGASVSGELISASPAAPNGRVEGVVNGDVFTFRGALQGTATIDAEEMHGQVGGWPHCPPCVLVLRRSGRPPRGVDER